MLRQSLHYSDDILAIHKSFDHSQKNFKFLKDHTEHGLANYILAKKGSLSYSTNIYQS